MSDELDFSQGKVLPPVRPPGWIGDSARSFIAWTGLLLALLGAAEFARTLSLWVGGERATAVVYWKETRYWEAYTPPRAAYTIFHYRFVHAGRMDEGKIQVVGASSLRTEGDLIEVVYWAAAPMDAVPTADLFSPSENPPIVYAILLMVFGGLSATFAFRARPGSSIPAAKSSAPPAAVAADPIPEALAKTAPQQIPLNIHFEPKECPACRAVFAVRYSLYQNARLHPLYGPFFVFGVVLTLTDLALAFWVGATVASLLTDGAEFNGRERGLLFLVLLTPWFVPIWYLTRTWFRRVQTLPRRFHIHCAKCEWSGSCRVVGAHS